MESIIEVKNLEKSYKEVKAVDDISFVVKKGQLFSLLGLNGAGKSTTINTIVGITKKDAGQVLIDGIDIDKSDFSYKSKIGIVFQNSTIDNSLTGYTNLKNKAALYGIEKKEFEENLKFLIEQLDLSKIINKTVSKLSGGQKRRIDIARALIHNPKILILDEPTTGLDPQTRLMVWNCLNELRQKKDLTILLTTHYMEEAIESEWVIIMDSGKIVAANTPNELKNQYAHDFIKIYNKQKEAITFLEKNGFSYNIKENYLEVKLNHVSDAKKLLIEYPEIFDDFEILKGSMDDVFLNVTGKTLERK